MNYSELVKMEIQSKKVILVGIFRQVFWDMLVIP